MHRAILAVTMVIACSPNPSGSDGGTDAGTLDAAKEAEVDASVDAPMDVNDSSDASDAGSCVGGPYAGTLMWWQGEGDPNDFFGANDLVTSGTVGYGAGQIGQAFKLTGAGHLAVSTNAFSGLSELTIELWIKFNIQAPLQRVLTYSDTVKGPILYLEIAGNTSVITFANSNGPLASPAIGSGAFHHLAFVYKAGTGLASYIDGQYVATAGPITALSTVANATLTIGANETGASPFTGDLDEVAVYGRALGSAEIAQIQAAGAVGNRSCRTQ